MTISSATKHRSGGVTHWPRLDFLLLFLFMSGIATTANGGQSRQHYASGRHSLSGCLAFPSRNHAPRTITNLTALNFLEHPRRCVRIPPDSPRLGEPDLMSASRRDSLSAGNRLSRSTFRVSTSPYRNPPMSYPFPEPLDFQSLSVRITRIAW